MHKTAAAKTAITMPMISPIGAPLLSPAGAAVVAEVAAGAVVPSVFTVFSVDAVVPAGSVCFVVTVVSVVTAASVLAPGSAEDADEAAEVVADFVVASVVFSVAEEEAVVATGSVAFVVAVVATGSVAFVVAVVAVVVSGTFPPAKAASVGPSLLLFQVDAKSNPAKLSVLPASAADTADAAISAQIGLLSPTAASAVPTR